MQIHGEIQSIGTESQVSERFKKREFVVITEQNSQYPQTILFELQQDRCDIIDPYKEGDQVSVDFNLKGRQWTDQQGQTKTFNTLVVWKIQHVNK